MKNQVKQLLKVWVNYILEIIVDRMRREFNVEANVGKPQVAYRETLKQSVEQEGKFVRQSGGRGQYGHVWLKIEPQEPGTGYEFVNAIVGGVIPKEYIPAVDKGVQEQMQNGVIAGYPVVDVKVHYLMVLTMKSTPVKWHLKLLVLNGFKQGALKAKPVLLEPIMKVEVVTPEDYMGDVMGDLKSSTRYSSRYGRFSCRKNNSCRSSLSRNVWLCN